MRQLRDCASSSCLHRRDTCMSAAACSCSSRRESWRPLTASCDTSSVKTEVKSGVPSMVSIVSPGASLIFEKVWFVSSHANNSEYPGAGGVRSRCTRVPSSQSCVASSIELGLGLIDKGDADAAQKRCETPYFILTFNEVNWANRILRSHTSVAVPKSSMKSSLGLSFLSFSFFFCFSSIAPLCLAADLFIARR